MKKLILLSLALTASLVQAETIRDRIHSIEDNLVKFENGRIAFINSSQEGLEENALVEAEVDDRSRLLHVKTLMRGMDYLDTTKSYLLDDVTPPPFEPTVLPNMAAVQKIYDASNPYYKRISECTDRAHVWAFDEFKRSGVKSRKVFVLFTASYINSVGFKWWFHVAPLYSVNVNGKIQDIVTDFRYTTRPMTIKEWTDSFVYTKRPCKFTTKFSEYDVNPQTENCYLMIESMYYRVPAEIFDQERKGIYKTSSSESEVNFSRRLAFELPSRE